MKIWLVELIYSIPACFTHIGASPDGIDFWYQDQKKRIETRFWPNGQPSVIIYTEEQSERGPQRGRMQWSRPYAEGPAYRDFHRNGKPERIVFYERGFRHRPIAEGSASQHWDKDGNLMSETYWENGEEVKIN